MPCVIDVRSIFRSVLCQAVWHDEQLFYVCPVNPDWKEAFTVVDAIRDQTVDFDYMIDYERYGRDIAMDEQGSFTDEGYVRVASERWDRQFDGELDDIPDEYRITGSGEAAERDSTIAVLIVEPGKEPYVKEIDSGLESLQHEVGGYIEAVYPYEDPVALVCNEEGKLEGLPLNQIGRAHV